MQLKIREQIDALNSHLILYNNMDELLDVIVNGQLLLKEYRNNNSNELKNEIEKWIISSTKFANENGFKLT